MVQAGHLMAIASVVQVITLPILSVLPMIVAVAVLGYSGVVSITMVEGIGATVVERGIVGVHRVQVVPPQSFL